MESIWAVASGGVASDAASSIDISSNELRTSQVAKKKKMMLMIRYSLNGCT
jgi:hypothetical protein